MPGSSDPDDPGQRISTLDVQAESVVAIEASIAAFATDPRLSAELESRYEATTAAERIGVIGLWLGLIAAIDALCVFIDFINIAGHVAAIFLIRIGLGVAPIVGARFVLQHFKTLRLADLSVVFACTVITLTGGLIGCFDTPEMRTVHIIACLLALFTALICLPISVQAAALAAFLCDIVFVGFVVSMAVNWSTKMSILIYFPAVMLAALVLHRTFEQRRRRAFLLRLRDAARGDTLNRLNEELRDANARLSSVALTDALTKIANRRAFDEAINHLWTRAAIDQTPICVFMIDVDSFKAFNDTFGHRGGDMCLRTVAGALAALDRPGDLLARYGGEEFVVIACNLHEAGCAALAETYRQAIESLAMPHTGSAVGRVTISVGYAWAFPQLIDAPEALIAKADDALYTAKKRGRNRVCAWDALRLSTAG